MSRALGIIITIVWLACMTALVSRDVVPYWRAQEPPKQQVPTGQYQVGITHAAGRRIGTTWVTTIHTSDVVTVHSTTRLDLREISSLLPIVGDVFFDTDLSYADDALDSFVIRAEAPSLSARIKGTRYEKEFACIAKVGSLTQSMALDAELSKYLGDSLRPFTHLEGLHVGQTWRLRLIDPIALMRSSSVEFTTRLVRVTARETITHRGRRVPCFRIETDGTVAWSNDAGIVLVQEVHVPLLGKWILSDEPFDDRARSDARRDMFLMREERAGVKHGPAASGEAGIARRGRPILQSAGAAQQE